MYVFEKNQQNFILLLLMIYKFFLYFYTKVFKCYFKSLIYMRFIYKRILNDICFNRPVGIINIKMNQEYNIV